MRASVSVLVADLRREPLPAKLGHERDLLQETQLLHGEEVFVLEEKNGWSKVETLRQPILLTGGSWCGYIGWIESSCLSFSNYDTNTIVQRAWASVYKKADEASPVLCYLPFGACCKIDHDFAGWFRVSLVNGVQGYLKAAPAMTVVEKAGSFLGWPYLWGGCSPYDPRSCTCNTSMDCSALIHLLYRSINKTIPRNAYDQFYLAQPVDSLHPGDLVFRSHPATPNKIDHVMLYVREETLIEACLEAACIRLISGKEKFGVTLNDIAAGVLPQEHAVFFRRLSKEVKLQV